MYLTGRGETRVVVPKFSPASNSICTGVFLWEEKSWIRLKGEIKGAEDGSLLRNEASNKLLFITHGKEISSVYEFKGVEAGWLKWRHDYELPVRLNANATVIPVPNLGFCENKRESKVQNVQKLNSEQQPSDKFFKGNMKNDAFTWTIVDVPQWAL